MKSYGHCLITWFTLAAGISVLFLFLSVDNLGFPSSSNLGFTRNESMRQLSCLLNQGISRSGNTIMPLPNFFVGLNTTNSLKNLADDKSNLHGWDSHYLEMFAICVILTLVINMFFTLRILVNKNLSSNGLKVMEKLQQRTSVLMARDKKTADNLKDYLRPIESSKSVIGISETTQPDLDYLHIYSSLTKVYHALTEKARNSGIQLKPNTLIDNDVWILSNKELVEEVVESLIVESFKHCDKADRIQLNASINDQNILIIELLISKSGEEPEDNRFGRAADSLALEVENDLRSSSALDAVRQRLVQLNGELKVEKRCDQEVELVASIATTHWIKVAGDKVHIPESRLDNSSPSKSTTGGKGLNILLVDRNPDRLMYLAGILFPNYNYICALDGMEAMQLLKGYKGGHIDLVFTAMQMPKMDGLELAKHIKRDPDLANIPIMLHSDQARVKSRLEVLQMGISDYIIKPISSRELLNRINNLLKKSTTGKSLDISILKVEDEPGARDSDPLVAKVEQILVREIANSSYNIDSLVEELGISKTTLFRKVKAATGMNTNQIFREIRLMKAREYLVARRFRSVAEVSYAVGIESPGYFSKIFYECFGVKPSSYLYIDSKY